jgi:hypothetical protein
MALIMSEAPTVPKPSQLWKQMPADRKVQAAEAFWRDDNATMEHAEAVASIAQRIKFRPKSVIALSNDKKARYLISLGSISELVAARLLVSYHLEHQRPMMAAFLDALGIAHDNGLIAEEDVTAPDVARLQEAAQSLAGSFPAEDVALYLSTLTWQDPDTWGRLAEAPEVHVQPSTK